MQPGPMGSAHEGGRGARRPTERRRYGAITRTKVAFLLCIRAQPIVNDFMDLPTSVGNYERMTKLTGSQLSEARRLRDLCGEHADTYNDRRLINFHRARLLCEITLRLMRRDAVDIRLSRTSESRDVKKYLRRHTLGLRTPLHQAALVIEVPTQRGVYAHSLGRQTLRRMCRKAESIGVYCKRVLDQDERQRLVRLVVEHERRHRDIRYRRESRDAAALERASLCVAAYTSDHRPLVLSVTPAAGNAAVLRSFQTLESSQEATLARYSLAAYLIDELAERGTEYLLDPVSPISITSGVHHFAGMLGFEIRRARLKHLRASATASPG